MATNQRIRRPMSISTINIDVDDIDTPPRDEYRQSYNFDETTSTEKDKRATRLFLIILIVVLLFIAALAITAFIIAIYSLVLIENKTTTASTTTTTVNTATTSPIICSSSPSTYYESSTTVPNQCLNYTTNTDPTRNVGYTTSISSCDNTSPFSSSTPIWFRFRDPAGTLVANSPVPTNHCGAVVTGWYAGQYPAKAYSTATSIACFYYSTNTCSACSSMSVTNCQTFYVFLLSESPSCNYRYCTL